MGGNHREYLEHIDAVLRSGAFQLTGGERMAIREVYNAVVAGDVEAAREAWASLPAPIALALGEPPDAGEGA